jgi:hypothetical protein
MSKPVIDPFLLNSDGTPDPFAANLYSGDNPGFGMTKEDEIDPALSLDEHGGLNPNIITGQPPSPNDEPAPPEPPTPAEPVEPEGPEVFEVEDGTVTLEKERGQWKATLVNNVGGNPQTYWGKNKNELLINAMKAQLNATAKIRELNKKVKLTAVAPPRQTPQAPQPSIRPLTADEVFEITTLWASDPSAALDLLIKKRTNVTLEELVGKAQRGDQASMNLETEAISKEFAQRNPDYYSDFEYKNFKSLIQWLAKFKLGKTATDANAGEIFSELWSTGNYTVDNLEEAFQDLTADGLMVKPRLPKTPPPVEVPSVPPAPQPAPATSDPRIVSRETRPRAALGIGRSDLTPVAPPATPTAPTDEDLENLSDAEIKALLGGVRRQRIAARRS